MLTKEQKEAGTRAFLSRRNLLKGALAVPAVGAFAVANRKLGAVKVACIGTGSEGGVLQDQMNRSPDFIKMIGVCDLYDLNREVGLMRARKNYPKAKDYGNDHKRVLDDPEVEGVVIATPLWSHGPIAIDALKAGKHVFTEKTMAYNLAECEEMIRLAKQKNLVLQVGHQRAYNPIYHQAVGMIREGMLGDIYHIRALWHRNSDWRADARWDIDESFDPTPWGYEDMEHLINWRLYKKHSRGLLTELCSHQVQVTNWVADKTPESVMATGGLYCHNDGRREVDDHLYCIFEYDGGLTVSYSAIQSNRLDDYYEQIMGTKGSLVLTHETQAMFFSEGDDGAPPQEEETEFTVSEDDGGEQMAASASRMADAAGSAVGSDAMGGPKMSPLTPYKIELEGYAHAIRTGEPDLCDGVVGMQAATAAVKAQESIDTGKKVRFA